MKLYYKNQLAEGMEPLKVIEGSIAHKYCGGGFGGYALYLFNDFLARDKAVEEIDRLRVVEPYIQ